MPGSGSPQSEGSHRDLSDEVLADVLLEPYDPSTCTLVEYQQRSQRCASSLRLRNVSFDREEFETQQLRAIQKDRAERSSSGPEVYLLCALQETMDSEERYEESQIVRGILPDYLPEVDWQNITSDQVERTLRQFGEHSQPSASEQAEEAPLNRRLFKSEGGAHSTAPAPAPGLALPSRAPARIEIGRAHV